MAYKLDESESVRDGIVRCAAEQLDRAVTELSERVADDPVDAVHAARKAIKRERSLLRMVRGSMPAPQRRRENRALREAAGELSAARDAEAMVATLDRLARRDVGQLPESAFDRIGERLRRTRDEQRAQLVGSARGARAVGELGAVRVRVDDWRLGRGGWSAIEDGLERAYADGRAAWRAARAHPTSADWHAWRKRAKDLWYQERLLGAVAGPAVAGQAKDAHRLSDLLGDDHDLGVLRQALTHEPVVHAPVDVDAVVALIDHRRAELRGEALHLGGRVYAERPGAFIRRMRRSWKAGRARAQAADARHPTSLAHATRTPHPA